VYCHITGAAPRQAGEPPQVDTNGSSIQTQGVRVFLSPDAFEGSPRLVSFEGQGREGCEVRRIEYAGFELVKHDSDKTTGAAPTVRMVSNTLCAREFPPQDGPSCLRNVSEYVPNTDLQIRFEESLKRMAVEIRSCASQDARELRFELYKGIFDGPIGVATVKVRGVDKFYFYGVESDVAFDRVIIRQLPGDQFDMDNLRYQPFAP
jgi:hypothetical protein